MTFHKVPKPAPPPACADCRYCWGKNICLHEELRTFDPVEGNRPSICADNRAAGGPMFCSTDRGKCGPEGKFWEARLPASPVPWELWLLLGLMAVCTLYFTVVFTLYKASIE